METAYILLAFSALLFGAVGIAGFLWAYRSGEFRNLDQKARSIFDDEDPP